MVVRRRALGGDVVRRASVLELVEPGCDQEHRKGLSAAGADGLSGGAVPADAGLLAEAAHASADVLEHCDHVGQFGAAAADAAAGAQLAGRRRPNVHGHAGAGQCQLDGPGRQHGRHSGCQGAGVIRQCGPLAGLYQNDALLAALQGSQFGDGTAGMLWTGIL